MALGRKNWLFAGSEQGGNRAASIYSLVETARLNGVDLEVWLTDTISRLADHPACRVAELLPWNTAPPDTTPLPDAYASVTLPTFVLSREREAILG